MDKVVCGLLSASILASSCSSNLDHDQLVYPVSNNNSDRGITAIDLETILKHDDSAYINALVKFSQDIIENPVLAKAALSDSLNVLKKYGYDGEIKLDEDLTKIVMALGDDEINSSLKKHDYINFIRLLKDKDLLTNTEKGILNKTEYNKQFRKVANSVFGYGSTRAGALDDSQLMACIPIAVVAVYVAAIIAIAGVAASTVAYMQFKVCGYLNRAMDSDLKSSDIAQIINRFRDSKTNRRRCEIGHRGIAGK